MGMYEQWINSTLTEIYDLGLYVKEFTFNERGEKCNKENFFQKS
jgi:hypothetical protein